MGAGSLTRELLGNVLRRVSQQSPVEASRSVGALDVTRPAPAAAVPEELSWCMLVWKVAVAVVQVTVAAMILVYMWREVQQLHGYAQDNDVGGPALPAAAAGADDAGKGAKSRKTAAIRAAEVRAHAAATKASKAAAPSAAKAVPHMQPAGQPSAPVVAAALKETLVAPGGPCRSRPRDARGRGSSRNSARCASRSPGHLAKGSRCAGSRSPAPLPVGRRVRFADVAEGR